MGYPRDGHKMIRKKLGDNEKGVKRIATLGNYSNIRKKLNDDEKATKRVNTLGGPQNTSIIIISAPALSTQRPRTPLK